jgi:glycosyltransferase involved in cell wall biosynthesis
MSTSLRIAVLVDPLTALVTDAAHPRALCAQLSAQGRSVELFGSANLARRDGDGARRRERVGASLSAFAPELVVAYDALSPAAWMGARAASRAAAALVVVEAGAWAEGRPAQRALWRVGAQLWGRYVRRRTWTAVALEPQAATRLHEQGFSHEQIELVAYGVDLEEHRPGRASEELARRRIGGRILSARTHHVRPESIEALIEGFAATVGQRDDWSLVLVGDGAPPPRVLKCAYRAGVGGRTHFLTLADEALAPLLSSSTLYASVGDDGAQAVGDVERALACGTPVLAVEGTRPALLVEHDVRGWRVERGDARAWSAALARASSAPQARKRWSLAARQFAVAHLGWRRLCDTVVEAAELHREARGAAAVQVAPRTAARA